MGLWYGHYSYLIVESLQFLPFVIDFANAHTILRIGGLETAVNHGVGVVKEANILPFVINPADIPRIRSIEVQTPGSQAQGLLNKTCSDS